MLSYAHCAKGALSCQLFHETPKALRLQMGSTVSSAPAPCVSSNQIAPEWVTTSFIAAYSLLAIGPVKKWGLNVAITFFALLNPRAGSAAVSSTIISIFRPMTSLPTASNASFSPLT